RGKYGVVESDVHGEAGLPRCGGVDQNRGGGSAPDESGFDDEARSFFQLDISGSDPEIESRENRAVLPVLRGRKRSLHSERRFSEKKIEGDEEGHHRETLRPPGDDEPFFGDLPDPTVPDGVFRNFSEESLL